MGVLVVSSSFASELVKQRPACFSKHRRGWTTTHVPSGTLGYIKLHWQISWEVGCMTNFWCVLRKNDLQVSDCFRAPWSEAISINCKVIFGIDSVWWYPPRENPRVRLFTVFKNRIWPLMATVRTPEPSVENCFPFATFIGLESGDSSEIAERFSFRNCSK